MPDEKDLREIFAADAVEHSLDPKRIVARSRARRLPKQLAAAAIGTLAVAGITVLAVQTTQFVQPTTTSMLANESADGTAPTASSDLLDSGIKRTPAERINLCTGSVAESVPSLYGLQLDVLFPATAPTGTAPIQGTVRLSNTGTTPVVGTTAATPAITLSQDGVVLWHSNGPMIASLMIVDLAPGASMQYQASFTPVRCEVDDDLAESFRPDLPAVPAGDYQLSAAIDFRPSAQDSAIDLVTGPRSSIELQ